MQASNKASRKIHKDSGKPRNPEVETPSASGNQNITGGKFGQKGPISSPVKASNKESLIARDPRMTPQPTREGKGDQGIPATQPLPVSKESSNNNLNIYLEVQDLIDLTKLEEYLECKTLKENSGTIATAWPPEYIQVVIARRSNNYLFNLFVLIYYNG